MIFHLHILLRKVHWMTPNCLMSTARSKVPHTCMYVTSVHDSLRVTSHYMPFKISALNDSKMTLNTIRPNSHYIYIYVVVMSSSPTFQSIWLYGQLLNYKAFWEKSIEWPQTHLDTVTVSPFFSPFDYTTSHLQVFDVFIFPLASRLNFIFLFF